VSHYVVAPILISGEEQREIVRPRTWAVIRCASPSQREAPITSLRIGASAFPSALYARLHCSSSPCTPRLMSVSIQPSFHGAVLSSEKGMPFTRASPPASQSRPHVWEYSSSLRPYTI
jgi:hypothetical protein